MLELNKTYSVIDAAGVTWGTVKLKWRMKSTLHGYLNPTKSFAKIYPLFDRYNQLMSQAHGNESEKELIRSKITNLGVVLKDADNDTSVDAGIVFVSRSRKGLLFACSS